MNNNTRNLKRSVKKMKILLSFLFINFFLQVNASPIPDYAQSKEFTFNFNKKTIEEVINYIEQNSEFVFLFYEDLVDANHKVNVSVKNESIENVLNNLLKGTQLSYEIEDRQIVLIKNDSPSAVAAPSSSQQQRKVTGKVMDEGGETLPGATVIILGSTRGVSTDIDGSYSIEVGSSDKLVFTFIGMESQIIDVEGKTVIDIKLQAKSNELDEVTVVAFGKQKKESVLASITTVKPAELKVPSSNLTTSLSGRVAGLISYQQSGEPGKDNAQFFIRGITSFGAKAKVDPLILIDGIELGADDLARLNTDDIASFSVMKDATATALYGARGANGVILITTKEGHEGKVRVSVRFENSISAPTRKVRLADPITYMKMNNEAVITRTPLGMKPYSQEKITMTERGLYPDRYPSTDWYDYMFNDYTMNQRANFNVSGGGAVARYYIAGSFAQDNGNLKKDTRNDYNTNIDLKKYLLRSNVNINVTKTTEAIVRLHATFDDYTGPISGGGELYGQVMQANPVLFKPFYAPDAANQHTKHILFGNSGPQADFINPYANMLKGHKDWTKTLMLAQFEVKQDFEFITKGLSGRFLFNTNRFSEYDVQRSYSPFYYNVASAENPADPIVLTPLNPTTGTEYIGYTEGKKNISSTNYMELAVDYSRAITEKHNVSSLLVGTLRQYSAANAGSLEASLPARNLGLSGRFTYNYNSRYFVEFNFGYNGSERFSSDKRFGFFPSVGGAWYISKESFFEKLRPVVSQLKLKGTYGLVGNDAIGDSNDRFFYLSRVEMGGANRTARFGEYLNHTINGVETVRFGNNQIGWETSYKTNVGLEISLFDKFTTLIDFFHDKRKNILVDRIIPSAAGLTASKTTQANLGVASSRGVDIESNYQHNITKDLWITARGTFTYATAKVDKWEEPDYSQTPWVSKVGRPITQTHGYIGERLFIDEEDIRNSPEQFGEYKPGDIKYKDINKDGKISTLDMVPIGHPTSPEINYGAGFSLGYKSIDFSVFFQGSTRQSFWVDTKATAPFFEDHALLDVYAKDYWSENNPNIYAFWPRLSITEIENNQKKSTWFMQDASFIRLKSLEVGYSIPKSFINKFKVEHLRLYVSGTNLLTWSRFKLWDPEMAGNGLGYPVQRVFNVGLNLTF